MKNYLYFLLMFMSVTGPSCEDGAPCSLIICANGGSCTSGTCDCADGYGGETCQELALPDSFSITQVVVSSVPLMDENGQPYDPLDGPDLYLVVSNTTTGSVFTSPSTYPNIEGGDTYSFEMGDGFPASTGQGISISLFDEDGTGNDPEIPLAETVFSAQSLVLKGGGYSGPYQFDATVSTTANISLEVDWGF